MVPFTRQGMLIIIVELVLLCKASQLPSKFPLEAKVQVTLQQFDCGKTTVPRQDPFPLSKIFIVHNLLPSQNALQVELKCKGNDRHLHRGKHVILSTCLVDATVYTTSHSGSGSFLGFEEEVMPFLQYHGV